MSGEIIEKYCKDLEDSLKELIEAAQPFTSGDTVDETDGTIPLMDRLEAAITKSKECLEPEE